ncbi:MAG TPA: hypothetical protein VGJ20_09070 [Xanthobacteraceae bacterium]
MADSSSLNGPAVDRTDEFDPMLDCYLSWEAFVAEMRRRHLAGESQQRDNDDGVAG